MENLDGFYILWLDKDGEEIRDEWVFKPTYEAAIKSAGRRLSQSPHLCPIDAGGFYIQTPLDYRKRRGLPLSGLTVEMPPKLSKAEFDKLQDELSAKYGPPPSDE